MKKYKNLVVWLATVLGSLTIVFLGLFISFLATSQMYKKQLENTYMKNFYEVVDNINDIEVDISKLIATNNVDSQRELLSSIYLTSVLCVNNINLLPIDSSELSNINNLLNKSGGFIYSLLIKNYENNLISESDFVQITDIHSKILEMQYDLNLYLSELQYDYSIVDDIDFKNSINNEFSAGLINTESANSKVPSLIYDGPFSDSVINKEIIGLENVEYTVDDASEYLHNIFSGFPIEYLGETLGKFETYNFSVKGDIELYVSVTKKGRMLLGITAFGSGEGINLTADEGIVLAETFAKDVGIDNMYSVWSQLTGNILYVNLAPIVNHTIYYPDLIKVKVDLSLGLVVGWEATGYATNHTDRKFSQTISILDASKLISPILNITEKNYTIIPDKYVGEISAYEFICTWKNYTYYIYIDSNTGNEVNILRVIDTSNGQLIE